MKLSITSTDQLIRVPFGTTRKEPNTFRADSVNRSILLGLKGQLRYHKSSFANGRMKLAICKTSFHSLWISSDLSNAALLLWL